MLDKTRNEGIRTELDIEAITNKVAYTEKTFGGGAKDT